ncbi:hypothetical protein ACWCQS_06550 [Streptomyces sp. NPDC002076]
MTAPDFWETGASGRRYSRAHVLDVLEERHKEPPAEEWTLVLDGRRTRRATLSALGPTGLRVVPPAGVWPAGGEVVVSSRG